MYNLVGGKIEEGEKVEEAAARELQEEAGLIGCNFKVRGACTGNRIYDPKHDKGGWVIWFVTCDLEHDWNAITCSQEGPVQWLWMDEALNVLPLIPNLKLIIPLLETKAPDWSITETPGGLVLEFYNWEMVPCTILQ